MSQPVPMPADGGSYARDPVTGELTQLEPPTAPPIYKTLAAAAAAAVDPKPGRKASGAKE